MELTPQQIQQIEAEREKLERQALFATCISKEHLRLWIKKYLGIDLPGSIVCDDDVTNPPSNSSPLDIIWEVYVKALQGDDESFQRVLAYAARDSFKTLSASIMEVLCLFHLRRNVAHMAAIESQAQKAASYLTKYLKRPYLRDYVEGNNKREITITRYESADGEILTPAEYAALDSRAQRAFEPISQYMKIIIATLSGANSEHVSFMVLDELDLAPLAPLEEAKMIPAPGEVRGELPITFMTSSRKFAFGNVQKEIDKAAADPQNGLQIRHWNLIDVTKACPPERHLPDEPRIPIYYSERSLKSIGADDYNLLAPEEQAKYFEQEGYTGCLKKCSLFSVCRGRLATKQTGTSKMLKPIPHVVNQFKSVSPEHAKAQLMCWKPSSEGLIYPHFQYSRHMLDPVAMYEQITGEIIPRKNEAGEINPEFIRFSHEFTKARLIEFMKEQGMEFHSGMDWGYTHNWAAVTGAKFGHRFFVFDVISIPNLEVMEKIEMAKVKLGHLPNLTVWADPEDPSSINTFRKHGFIMKKFKKDVHGGIEAVRAKILPGLNKEPEIFFLAGDEGCELLAQRMSQYHWKIDANQRPTDIPDDKDDDECFTATTEVLTLQGWKSLADLCGDESVLAVDEKGRGKWEVPELVQKPYDGAGWRIDHPHLSFSATEGHRHAVMTQYQWKVAKSMLLQKRTVSEMTAEMYWANNLSEWPTGEGAFASEDEAWMAGFWVAEGCFDASRPTYLIVDQTKEDRIAEIRSRAASLGWKWSETRSGKSIRFVFSGQGMRASEWRRLFGDVAENKRLPLELVMKMSESERRALWEGYMAGDGSRTGSSWHFDSVSRQLIEDMQVLTMSLGYGCRIVSYDCMKAGRRFKSPSNGKIYSTSRIWRGHVLRKRPVAHIKTGRFLKVHLSESVYCVRTSTGAFLARSEGKPFVAGNCDALRYVVPNIFGNRGRFIASVPGVSPHAAYDPAFPLPHGGVGTDPAQPHTYRQEAIQESTADNWMQRKIDELTQNSPLEESSRSIKKGRFIAEL